MAYIPRSSEAPLSVGAATAEETERPKTAAVMAEPKNFMAKEDGFVDS